MQNDNVPRQYFFDDDDSTIKFAFEKPEEKHEKDLQTPFILKDTFSTGSTASTNPGRGTYALHHKLLAYYKNEFDKRPEHVIDLLHSRVNVLKSNDETKEYGFSVSKNGSEYQFYTSDKLVFENWMSSLKKVCVLTSFHDDYKAIKMIGRGSFAKVYLVESKTSGKSFAVKAFTKETMNVSNKSNAKPSMLNEISIMRDLDHENIIKLYEVYETEKSIYLVLELIQGKSLYDFLKKANFREEVSNTRIINMVRSLLDALAYLSSKGIMHRDLKPDNILLDKGEKVKIVDFGLATVIDVPNYIFKKCGTPGYIAPEVFKYDEKDSNTSYNDRCDVFSIGCLLYYMLYSIPMFAGTTAADILKSNRKYAEDYPVLNNIKMDIKDPNNKISKDGLNLLIDLLEADMKKRISASTALSHSYFIPVPTGMQKIIGSNEFIVDALSKQNQNEIYSPCSPLKTNFLAQDQVYSPLTPMRIDTQELNSPGLPPTKQERIVKGEDSLYLDIGRPEINGRIDTITNGSTNNSLLLASRVDSSINIASPCLPSAFANKGISRGNSKVFKPHHQSVANSSFRKAAIFRNMQKKNSEGLTSDDSLRQRIGEYREPGVGDESPLETLDYNEQKNREDSHSPTKGQYQYEYDGHGHDTGNENDGTPLNYEHVNLVGHGRTTNKPSSLKSRKFQPFAAGNLIIPKNDTHN